MCIIPVGISRDSKEGMKWSPGTIVLLSAVLCKDSFALKKGFPCCNSMGPLVIPRNSPTGIIIPFAGIPKGRSRDHTVIHLSIGELETFSFHQSPSVNGFSSLTRLVCCRQSEWFEQHTVAYCIVLASSQPNSEPKHGGPCTKEVEKKQV